MHRFVQKNIKLINNPRLRHCGPFFHNHSVCLRFSKACSTLVPHKKSFATIAHKYNSNYESDNIKENTSEAKVNKVDVEDIDKVIKELDFIVQRTGRIRLQNVESAFAMVENIGFVSGTQSLYLLRCCNLLRFESPVKRVDYANKMWNKFQMLGVQYDVKHYNTLLKVYLESNHEFSPSEILVSMESQGVSPNNITYGYLIEKYCKDGNLNGANEILEYMKEKEIPINETIFISLIKGHMKIDDISGAEEIIEVMRASNVSYKENSYTALACGFAEKGNFDKVEEILTEAKKNKISLRDHHYFQIITSLTSADNVDKILERMENVQEMQQEFLNAAMDLIYRGSDDIAYKLVLATSSPQNNSTINMLIKLLIKSDLPIEKIVQYCCDIYDKGLNSYVFIKAAMASLDYEKFDCAMAFFDEMHKRGIPVRNNNFWPILLGYKHSPDGIWKILRKMSDLGLMVDIFTYVEYVIPAVSSLSPDVIISKIQDCGQPPSSSIAPLFEYYCFNGKLDQAILLTEKYDIRINDFFKLERYLSLYDKFEQNPSKYFKILKYIMENFGLPGQDISEIQGRKLAFFLKHDCNLFEAFHKSTYGKSCEYSEKSLNISRRIMQKKSPNLVVYLQKLRRDNTNGKLFQNQNEPKHVQLLKQLLLHIQNRDLERFKEVKSELDNMNFIIAPVTYAQIFSLYCEMNDIDGAKDTLMKLKELHPTFQLNSSKIFDYARLLLKFSQKNEALEIIKNECKEINNFGGMDTLLTSLRRFLNSALQTNDIDFLKAVQNELGHKVDSPQMTIALYEPIVKLYLHREDYENSLKEFNNCVKNYSCVPCLSVLMKRLVLAGEETKLQSVIDSAAKVEGKIKVLTDLFLTFINLSQLDRARKIIQNLQGKLDFEYLIDMCEELYSQKKVTELEDVLLTTKGFGLKHKDVMYHYLLKAYDQKNDWKMAAQTLELMAEETIEPNQKSKELINKLFRRNKQPAPFDSNLENSTNMMNVSFTEEFLNFLNNKDADEALKELGKMKKGIVQSIPLPVFTRFIELLVERGVLNALSDNVPAMSYIIENSEEVLKPFLDKYSENGNVEGIKSLASTFPDFALKRCGYSYFLSKAYVTNNRLEDLLTELESRWDKKNKLFSTLAFEELLKDSNLAERVLQLARKYLDVNFDYPLAIVWAHYFCSENYEKANEIYELHTIPVDRVDSAIFRVMRQNENISLGKKYVEIVDRLNPKPRTKERAYGFLLDLLVFKQLYDDAADLVVTAQNKDINLEKHYNSTLMTLVNALERENKPIPFNMPSEKSNL